jgi:hypothetical protein
MQKSDYKNMWVYIEHDGKTAAPVGLELCCELRKLCDVTGDKLYAVILGDLPHDCGLADTGRPHEEDRPLPYLRDPVIPVFVLLKIRGDRVHDFFFCAFDIHI